jgi:hypothetical protein
MAVKIPHYEHAGQLDLSDVYCRLHSISGSNETPSGKLVASARFRIYVNEAASKLPKRDEDAPLPLGFGMARPEGLFDFDVSFTYAKDELPVPKAYAAALKQDICKDAEAC